jgi:hypothetical protein
MSILDSLMLTLPELVLTGAALTLMLVAAFAGDRATRLVNAGAIAALIGLTCGPEDSCSILSTLMNGWDSLFGYEHPLLRFFTTKEARELRLDDADLRIDLNQRRVRSRRRGGHPHASQIFPTRTCPRTREEVCLPFLTSRTRDQFRVV